MKLMADARRIERLREAQGGVFSTADLRTSLADRHRAGFQRRVAALVEEGELRRFSRGIYVARDFDLAVLSQRIAPDSCISFETVLARELVIGTDPRKRVVATRVGKARRYSALGFEVEHVGVAAGMDFGQYARGGVRFADAERAVLDVLYFHLRGRRYAFDVYSDMSLRRLSPDKLRTYLSRYRNPKFVRFAERVLELA